MPFEIKSPQEIQQDISQRFKERRLVMHLTREGLAKRSGVNTSSLKRFEVTGKISFESLLKLALVLECLNDFDSIARANTQQVSLNEILNKKKIPKKGHIK
ncbi:MAG: helix-turn-helix domain-containing protein [Gammaproteobacteria bacterium]|nr:helix-turn-helix domain-containing protein [Gammaproteobacteria bacterium]